MTSAIFKGQSRSLNGPERVAALLLSLDKFVAKRVLKHFDQNELRQITRFAAGLGSISAKTLEPLIDNFVDQFSGGVNLRGTAGEAEQLLTGIIPPEDVADIMSDVLGNSNHLLWERLSSVSDIVLANYLIKEHPQTAALILSKVDPSSAARVLGRLPSDMRNALMRRMLVTKPVVNAAMRILEMTIQEDLLLDVARNAAGVTNARMAEIINKMDREQIESVLQNLAETRPKIAEVLRGLLFTFDDIMKLSPRARMVVFDQIPAERVILALRGTDPATRDPVLAALSSRVRRMVEQELASGDLPPRRDILKARRSIADAVLKLAAEGKIDLQEPDDDGGQ
ncbi:MAG: flagellar motor switch protein FliG [Methylocystis sp.]|nr:flagellar motor switch protein FliG [Methylocystis sp.]